MNELRPYQQNAIQDLREAFRRGCRVVGLMLPTGAGKTQIAAEMLRNALAKGLRCLFIVDRLELLEQASKRFDEEGLPHGIIQGNHERNQRHQPLQVCSIQTLSRRKIHEFDLAIIDEFHVLHRAHKKIIAESQAKFVGLSATPFAKSLGKVFENLVVGATTSQLIDEKFLISPRVFAPSKPDLTGVKTVAGDYATAQLDQAANQSHLVGDIVTHWKKLAVGRPTLCFAVSIAHSKNIVEKFNAEGIKAAHVDAYTDSEERTATIEKFKRGELQILSCVDILSKGFDHPPTSCLILARPTKSLILHIQQCGRVLRIAEGKTDAVILDHAGNTERLGFVTDPLPNTLDTGKKAEQKKMERKEALPTPCSSCAYVKAPKVHKCPMCGFAPQKQANVETEEGELKELIKRKQFTNSDKQLIFSELNFIARQHGYKAGWVAHKYRTMTGVWPRGLRDTPTPPRKEIASWVRSQQIRFVKGQKHASA